jgi:peptidoglycan/LPS O-acetylase OafA/YrhL
MTSSAHDHPKPETPRIFTFEAINGWRGIGSIAIAIAHLEVISDFAGVQHLRPVIFLVDLFFVVSGLIIAQTYGQKLQDGAAVVDYSIRRFGRIWPLHAAMLALLVAYESVKLVLEHTRGLTFFAAPFVGGTEPWAVVTNALLIQSLGLHARETWNFPSWSLSVEFAIYLVFALISLAGIRRSRWLSLLALLGSLLVLVVFAPAGMRSTYDFGVFRCAVGFFAGVLAYEVARAKLIPAWPCPTLVEILVFLAAGIWMFTSDGTAFAYAAPVFFFVLVSVFMEERGALSRWFRHRRLQAMADLSYAIYVVHAVVLMGFMAAVRAIAAHFHLAIFIPTPPELVPVGMTPASPQLLHFGNLFYEWLTTGFYGTLVVLVAFLGHKLVEVPARQFFNDIAKRVSRATDRAKARTALAHATPASRGLAP